LTGQATSTNAGPGRTEAQDLSDCADEDYGMIEKAILESTDTWAVRCRTHVPDLSRPIGGPALKRALGQVGGMLRIPANSAKRWV